MTTQNGHCEHCDSDCLGGKVVKRTFGQTVQFQWHGTWGVRWDYECPFCEGAKAERERIVKLMRSEAEREWASELEGSHYAGNALDMTADDIEHGEHLEDQ